jgi:hypothetical protein
LKANCTAAVRRKIRFNQGAIKEEICNHQDASSFHNHH